MSAELWLRRRCEHGEFEEHCTHSHGLMHRGDEACSRGYCHGGSDEYLDPQMVAIHCVCEERESTVQDVLEFLLEAHKRGEPAT